MTDTQKRIKAYKAALPGLRERVTAVALLLVMSISMMTSATFAWLTISRRPEVTGVSTNVTANGNLEIALATSEKAPGDSQVGDSTSSYLGKELAGYEFTEDYINDAVRNPDKLTYGFSENESVYKKDSDGNPIPVMESVYQDLTGSNVTWGNLVNLSDPSYGLQNLTLRPAQLNTAALLTSPLYGADYGLDGRISKLNSSFGFATWVEEHKENGVTIPGYFEVNNNLGVRAISSTKIEAVGASQTYLNLVTLATETNMQAANDYAALANKKEYMQSLATLMGHYMTNRMNSDDSGVNNPTCKIEDLENLREMYRAFLGCFDKEAEAIARLIELQLFVKSADGTYQPWTADMVYGTTGAQLKTLGIQVSELTGSGKTNTFDQFLKDRKIIAEDLENLEAMCADGGNKTWKDSGISTIVTRLVNVGNCTVTNGKSGTLPISSIGAEAALGYLGQPDNVATITNGILYNFEERTGGRLRVEDMEITVTIKRSILQRTESVVADIVTSAPDGNLFTKDLEYAKSQFTGKFEGGDAVSEDTYGMALDLWVRTNAEGSYLTLEGNVITQTDNIQATTTDINGNETNLYTVTLSEEVEDEEGNTQTQSQSYDLYKIVAEDETETWYYANNHTVVPAEDMEGLTPILKTVEKVTVIGYEGENRVWGDNTLLSSDATTQGNGSCYIYYADTPEDQARSLKLLEAFNVVFVSSDGKKLATATMDTERFFAQSGRVIVPLVLSTTDSIGLGEDYEGNTLRGITALEKNVPTRITAIIYLDGTKLTNQEVLAAADIQGQLNIQFGSSQALDPIENEDLANKILQVSADIPAEEREFDYDTHTGPMVSHVNLTISGDAPSKVTGFFVRAISSTQGSREEEMTFTYNEATGLWVAQYEFKSPGNYVLRSVQLDGQEYMLSTTPSVTVKGFALKSLSCQQATEGKINIMSAANSATVDLRLQFATDDREKMPTSVQGRFLREDGTASNINFTYNATNSTWTGQATFLASGEYTLQYLVLDGEYVEIDSAFHQQAHVVLGMRVAVYTTSPHEFKYIPSEMKDNEKNLAMQVKIMDNAGQEMPGLSGAKLTYAMQGSATVTMDTDMKWDGSYYVGELHTKGPGIWQFSNVVVGNNTLTTATTAPEFIIASPEPPSYFAHNTTANQYKPNNNAEMTAQIKYSSSAAVWARIVPVGTPESEWDAKVNNADKYTWVKGKMGDTTDDVTNWTFEVPKDANGYQDGNWQLVQLKITGGAFDADGNQYTEESPWIFNAADTNNVTKVVSRVFITFPENLSKEFGKDANGNITSPFMTTHEISGLSVSILDFEGDPVSGVSDVKLTFAHNGKSNIYGGYTSDDLSNATAGATIEVSLSDNGGGTYSQTTAASILYAGEYTTTFSFMVKGNSSPYTYGDGKTYALPKNAPVFSVWSMKPTVEITAISPTGTYSYDDANSGVTDTATGWNWSGTKATATLSTNHKTGAVASFDAYNATVYFRCTHPGTQKYTVYGAFKVAVFEYHNYTRPSVTLNLSGISTGMTAELKFGDSVQLYNGTTQTTGYSWTANGTCVRNVGGFESKTAASDAKTPAKTITASTLTVTYNGMTFTFTVPTITIRNDF